MRLSPASSTLGIDLIGISSFTKDSRFSTGCFFFTCAAACAERSQNDRLLTLGRTKTLLREEENEAKARRRTIVEKRLILEGVSEREKRESCCC